MPLNIIIAILKIYITKILSFVIIARFYALNLLSSNAEKKLSIKKYMIMMNKKMVMILCILKKIIEGKIFHLMLLSVIKITVFIASKSSLGGNCSMIKDGVLLVYKHVIAIPVFGKNY